MDDLIKQAISAALHQDWQTAITLNKTIVDNSKNNIDAIIRLAYAYTRIGNKDKAKQLYKQALMLDRYNHIAKKNLERLNSFPNLIPDTTSIQPPSEAGISPSLFIEEPGRTKTITLVNLAPVTTLMKLKIGDRVFLNPKKHTVEVRNSGKNYIGAIPDDVSFRLIRFLNAGNQYDVFVKKVATKCVVIFVKESKRGKKFQYQPTFMSVPVSVVTQRINPKREIDDEQHAGKEEFC